MNRIINTTIQRAKPDDLEAVLALLGEVELPTEGVAEHFGEFSIARDGGKLIGCIGQERYADVTAPAVVGDFAKCTTKWVWQGIDGLLAGCCIVGWRQRSRAADYDSKRFLRAAIWFRRSRAK